MDKKSSLKIINWGIEHYSAELKDQSNVSISKKLLLLKKHLLDQTKDSSEQEEPIHELCFLVFHGISNLKDPFEIFSEKSNPKRKENVDNPLAPNHPQGKEAANSSSITEDSQRCGYKDLGNDIISKKIMTILKLILQIETKRQDSINCIASMRKNRAGILSDFEKPRREELLLERIFHTLKQVAYLRTIFQTPYSIIQYKAILNFFFPISKVGSCALDSEAAVLKHLPGLYELGASNVRNSLNQMLLCLQSSVSPGAAKPNTQPHLLLQSNYGFRNQLETAKKEFKSITYMVNEFLMAAKGVISTAYQHKLDATLPVPPPVLMLETVLSRIGQYNIMLDQNLEKQRALNALDQFYISSKILKEQGVNFSRLQQ